MLRNKTYCCKLAESCAYDWSVVCKQRWRLLNSFSVGRERLPLSVWALSTRCPKDYRIPQGLCIGKISGFPIVSGLQLQTHLLRPLRPPCFFLICRVGRASLTANQYCSQSQVKFAARQVEASVVIRATKLKFVAENRTRVYFSQHVFSTCNIVFCCETSWSRRW